AVEGLSGPDRELVQLLRRGGKPVFLAANKIDSNRREEALDLGELHATGFDGFPVSAEHGRGVDDLMDAVAAKLREGPGAEAGQEGGTIHLAMLGRPNVGKSTLLNRLLGEERFVAHEMPGTTRDAVEEEEARRLREEAKRHLQHVDFAPLLFVSALEGTRVHKILELGAELHDEASRRIATPQLNDWVQQMQEEHPAPLFRGFPVRFSYAYQV